MEDPKVSQVTSGINRNLLCSLVRKHIRHWQVIPKRSPGSWGSPGPPASLPSCSHLLRSIRKIGTLRRAPVTASSGWGPERTQKRSLNHLASAAQRRIPSGIKSNMAGWKIPYDWRFLARKIIDIYGPFSIAILTSLKVFSPIQPRFSHGETT